MNMIALLLVSGFLLICATGTEALAGPNEDLLAASKAGDRSGVEAALTLGASANAVDPVGLPGETTPLGIAAVYGHRNVAEALLDRGANVNIADGLQQTPLHTAAEYGSADVAQLLLDRGANVDARDFLGATPLQYACLRGQKTVAALLIAHSAIVNAQALSGKTALHLAATAGHKEIVAYLLAHGADVKVRNTDGQTPLQEMQASSLDAATKANIATTLRAPIRVAPAQKPAPTTQLSAPPVNSQTPASNTPPACTDLGGIARLIMSANPGLRPGALAVAVEKYQVAMGCRPAPQVTQCSWIGAVWTCKTQ